LSLKKGSRIFKQSAPSCNLSQLGDYLRNRPNSFYQKLLKNFILCSAPLPFASLRASAGLRNFDPAFPRLRSGQALGLLFGNFRFFRIKQFNDLI
jgi:hypothetical protein